MARGLLIVFSGPSGVGKGTVRALFADKPELNIAYSISMTSREKRPGEQEGVDYHYVSREEFEKAIANDELLEYAEFVGNYYGTPKAFVEKLRDEGKNVLLEIEVEGASIVKEKCPDALSIFLIPPSMEELERRIRGRKTEPEEIVQQRLAKAQREMNNMSRYQYVICNDDAQLAADIISLIISRYAKAKQQEED